MAVRSEGGNLMVKKKKVEEPKVEAPATPETVEVKTFDYGDLAVVCSCGRTQIITKGIEKGLQLILTTREDSFIQLKCDECSADIKLCFLEGVKPEEPNEITEPIAAIETVDVEPNEVVQEEGKQE